MGIEPTLSAWKAEVLPLNYTRLVFYIRMLFVTCYVVLKSLLQASYKFGCSAQESNLAFPWLMRPSASTRRPPAS